MHTTITPDVARLRDLFVQIWERADPETEIDGPAYTPEAQARQEERLRAFIDVLEGEARRAARRDPRINGERRVLSAFSAFASDTLGWPSECLEGALPDAFRDALRAFPARARRFDPALATADIYQAARNALTMHCLQGLLGVSVESTPAVLGYSLLYPYTDNLLDDPHLDAASKLAFGWRLGERLRDRPVASASTREARIFALVDMIEGQFPRARHPEVSASLLAIHGAQLRSLALLAGPKPPDDRTLIEVAVEKGGTSGTGGRIPRRRPPDPLAGGVSVRPWRLPAASG